jgi:hypothetical protein
MTTIQTTAPPRWWTDPGWATTAWTWPRFGRTSPGTPEIGEPCACGYRETAD